MSKADYARELLVKFPTLGNREAARKLYLAHVQVFKNLDDAHRSVRYVRGKSGKRNRDGLYSKKTLIPELLQEKIPYPESIAEDWTPFEITGKHVILNLSDLHIPYHSDIAVRAAIKTAKKHNPDIILLNGDLADFYAISRWQKKPSKRNFKQEIDLVRQFLKWLRQQFPKARIIYKAGNHEERWDAYVWEKCTELWELPQMQWPALITYPESPEAFAMEWVAQQRVIYAGNLPIMHGHELPKGLTNPVNQARGAFLRTISTTLTAHGHRTSNHIERLPLPKDNDLIVSWSQGCLCEYHPEYARINKWNWGFVIIELEKDKTFNLHNYIITKGGKPFTV